MEEDNKNSWEKERESVWTILLIFFFVFLFVGCWFGIKYVNKESARISFDNGAQYLIDSNSGNEYDREYYGLD